MNKRELEKRVTGIRLGLAVVRSALDGFSFNEVAEELDELHSEVEETAESVKSESLREEWEERGNSLSDVLDKARELEEAFEGLDMMLTDLEELGGVVASNKKSERIDAILGEVRDNVCSAIMRIGYYSK